MAAPPPRPDDFFQRLFPYAAHLEQAFGCFVEYVKRFQAEHVDDFLRAHRTDVFDEAAPQERGNALVDVHTIHTIHAA